MASLGARIVVAGSQSGVGKTTVATGLIAALRAAGHRPAAAKVGPDFIDPGYHSLASGRPPRNLDPWLCGLDAVGPLAGRAAEGADLLVIEGVMGLFDGAADGTPSSTADVAVALDAPVLLVVDARALAASVAAVVHGFATLDPRVRVAGVVLNQVGSDSHEQQLRDALVPLGIPVVGALRRDDRLVWRDRHLGLVPVAEEPAAVEAGLARLAGCTADQVDLDAVLRLARSAPAMTVGEVALPRPLDRALRVGVTSGAAFTFTYTDTLDCLTAAGATPVPFDPLRADQLPDNLDGLLLAGGFPEVHGAELAANAALRSSVGRAIEGGLPTWAECGGLLWLCRSLDGHPGIGAIDAEAQMTDRLTLGYRTATTLTASPIGAAGTVVRGHEFHYANAEPAGTALELVHRWGRRPEGHATATLLATFLHHHPGGDPSIIEAFLSTCADRTRPRH